MARHRHSTVNDDVQNLHEPGVRKPKSLIEGPGVVFLLGFASTGWREGFARCPSSLSLGSARER